MTRQTSDEFTTLRINAHMLGAVASGFTAWAIWPSSMEYWGFGFMSLLLAPMAPALLIKALYLMWKRYQRDKLVASFEAEHKAPERSDLAQEDALRRAGVIK